MGKYVVLDLEMCNVPKSKRTKQFHWANELIQIGAVLVDESLEIIDQFMTYVKPEYGCLDSRIIKLTGITEENLMDAPTADVALKNFFEWVPEGSKLVSWSDNDERQIRREVEGKDIGIENFEDVLAGWIDCQKSFSVKMESAKVYRLMDALNIADIDYDERLHDGLVDAYNTALLFVKMEKEPVLQVSTYYVNLKTAETTINSPFADLFANMNICVA